MPKPLRTQFVIADGSRARWVSRSPSADDFLTCKELKAAERLSGGPQGVVFEGSTGRRFSVEEKATAVREHRDRFAREVADAINAGVANSAFDRLAIVAPARVLSAISRRLSAAANAKLARTLAKDLTKTPDHQLGAWLPGLERD